MIARALVLLPMLLVLSCGSNPPPPAKGPPPQPWTGTWTLLHGLAIPPEKKLTLNQSCTQSADYWTIEEKDNVIFLEFHEGHTASGVAFAVETQKVEKARGQRRGNFVHLDGRMDNEVINPHGQRLPSRQPGKFPVTYELDWDPKTDHLAGTRNGSPVRFVRAELAQVDYGKCQPVP